MSLTVAYLVGRFPVRTERVIAEEIAAVGECNTGTRIVALRAGEHAGVAWAEGVANRMAYLDPAPRSGRLVRGTAMMLRLPTLRGALPSASAAAHSPDFLGSPLATSYRRRRLAAILRENPPDVLHAQFGHLGLLAAPVAQALGRPLVVSFRGEDVTLMRNGPAEARRFLFKSAVRVFARCNAMKQRLLEMGCPPERLTIEPSGLRLDRFPFHERTPPEGGRPVRLLFVGRDIPRKGADAARRAVAACADAHRIELTTLHDAPDDLVLDAMRKADLFILPSRTGPDGDEEGIPNAIKEAMACGLPVLSTRHGGIPELVEHERSGLLSDENDFDGLVANLRRMLAEPERWAEMGRCGRDAVRARFDVKRIAPRLVKHYRDVMQKGNELESPSGNPRAGRTP